MYRLRWPNNSLHLFSKGAGFDSGLEYPLSFLRALVISKSLKVNTQNSVQAVALHYLFLVRFPLRF